MAEIRFTLLSEGTSDQALIPIILWILRQKRSDLAINYDWANPQRFPNKPENLLDKIRASIDFFPCDVLFIHRDSDSDSSMTRRAEIEKAVSNLSSNNHAHVAIVPVQETEAWFLFDEDAIRSFVGNLKGKESLNLPPISRIETTADPKSRLNEALNSASKNKGRRKKSYDTADSLISLAFEIRTYAPLRKLPAFEQLELDIDDFLKTVSVDASNV